jgi:hypothetical protein
MDNVQKDNILINISSSQNFISDVFLLLFSPTSRKLDLPDLQEQIFKNP